MLLTELYCCAPGRISVFNETHDLNATVKLVADALMVFGIVIEVSDWQLVNILPKSVQELILVGSVTELSSKHPPNMVFA